MVVRRRTWMDADPFDIRLRNAEDGEMWIRLARHGRRRESAGRLPRAPFNSALDIEEVILGTRLIEAPHHTRADWGLLHCWLAECLRSGDRVGAAVVRSYTAFP